MIQVASRALKISGDKIHIMETSTDKVPNTSPTAASAGSDLNGMAVLVMQGMKFLRILIRGRREKIIGCCFGFAERLYNNNGATGSLHQS